MMSKIVLAALFASSAVASNLTTVTTTTVAPATSTMPHLVYTSIVGVLQFTTTLTPLQSSASSGSGDGISLGSSSFAAGGSLNQGSSASDSWGSGESSGHHGSGSSGSILQIWQWILLVLLLCCCLGACAALASLFGRKKRAKKTQKKVAPTAKYDAPGSTHLSEAAERGATKMHINSDYGFKIGDMIDVGRGTAESEINEVKAFGSIICATPLKNHHPKGSRVVKVARPAAPSYVPDLMPLLTTSQLIPSYSYVEPVTTTYVEYAAPQTASYSYAQPAQQQAYTYAAPATTAYAQPQMGGYTSYAAPQQQFGTTTGMVV